jgi:hypothetical protein
LLNDTCNSREPEQTADIIVRVIMSRGNKVPGFYFFRTTWVSPSNIVDSVAALHRKHPDLKFEVLDPHTFFALFKESQRGQSEP